MFGLDKVLPALLKGEKPQPFGHGEPAVEEATCKEFQVFMECKGYLNRDREKKLLPAGSTVADAGKAFGRPMEQEEVRDENGYALDPDSKLFLHSNKCRLNLTFAYSQSASAHFERLRSRLPTRDKFS